MVCGSSDACRGSKLKVAQRGNSRRKHALYVLGAVSFFTTLLAARPKYKPQSSSTKRLERHDVEYYNHAVPNARTENDFEFYVPKSCKPAAERGFIWSTLLNHTRRNSDPQRRSSFALVGRECEFDETLLPYLKARTLVVVDRRPKQEWLEYGERLRANFLSLRYAVANCRKPYFKSDKDICLIHEPNSRCKRAGFTSTKTFFATFKGLTYFSGRGTHRYLLKMFDDYRNGVLILTTYSHKSNDIQIAPHSLITRPRLLEEEQHAHKFDYCDVLNTTYAFVPSGRSSASYRLMEALLAGAIPIPFLEQDDAKTELPYSNIIDWNGCMAQNTELPQIHRILSEDIRHRIARRKSCENILHTYLATPERRAETLLQAIYKQISVSF